MIAQITEAKLPESAHKFSVIAHRGDHSRFPENTLAAFAEAIKIAADYAEMDLRTTRDSVLVILHDASVDRMTGGKGKVADMTYSQLKDLKIPGNNAGISGVFGIPRFDEVLALCQNKIHVYLDFKDASVTQAFLLLKKYAMENQTIVYINSMAQYISWRKIAPSIPLIISLPDTVKTTASLTAFLISFSAAVLDGNFSDYTKEMVGAAAAANVLVWPDIQGDQESTNWERALSLGFTGLQTDHPAAIIAWLTTKGRR